MTKRATTSRKPPASRKAPARKAAPVKEAPSSEGSQQVLLIGAIVVAVLLMMGCCLTLVLAWFLGDSIVKGLSSAAGLVALV